MPRSLKQVGLPIAVTRAAIPADNPQTPDKIELGEKLFFDGRLSADGTVACSTCHDPAHAFTDGRAKPSHLHVPPWQMVSAVLGGISLRTATWWASPKIYSTTTSSEIGCWDDPLSMPGAVQIATTGQWGDTEFALTGGPSANGNHAKIGVSISGDHHYSILGDMNQQGDISGSKFSGNPNGRGGLFFAMDNATLFEGLRSLIAGNSAPSEAP